MIEKAAFAAGCFWHVQESFDKLPGVLKTRVGFMGGNTVAPSYHDVCRGNTGHAETVEIEFDSNIISYQDLVLAFFAMHDPTSRDRQGPDVGSQYRSAIFYDNEQQKQMALRIIQQLDESHRYAKAIVTQVAKMSEFYPAEEAHQKYFAKQCGFPHKE